MISYTCLSPHPPLIIPEIGGDSLNQVKDTVQGMESLARQMAQAAPDVIVFLTPHGNVFADCLSCLSEPQLSGNFSSFGHGEIELEHVNDLAMIEEIARLAYEQEIEFIGITGQLAREHHLHASLDHGILVPLYYLNQAGLTDTPIVAISIGFLPVLDLYNFGRILARAANNRGRKMAIVASGDMSHRLRDDGPYRFNPDGPRYDETIRTLIIEQNIKEILNLPHSLLENAGECGYRSLVIMLGALDGVEFKSQVFSYQGPFGVGYLTAGFEPVGEKPSLYAEIQQEQAEAIKAKRRQESLPVQLARKTLEGYIKTGQAPALTDEFKSLQGKKAAAFVSLKKNGQLRGCIGTIVPYQQNLAEEIINNAISAGTRDPRFSPVSVQELDQLVYSVDILGTPEPCTREDLDPQKYGVIVSRGHKRGVLLPALEGVDSVEEQLEIALQKAGISRDQKYKIERFEVQRFT
ncbi:MAG: AmmeMemoRadiSam system protein A [Syntrophomonadaceae bacterium]|jgi:AmmeMemoRadiSam system protein A